MEAAGKPPHGGPMLFGRQTEQRVLLEIIAAADDFRGGALVVRGRPGVGKTALLVEALARVPDALILSAQGVEGDSQLVFSGAQQLLRPLLGRLQDIPPPQAAALRVALGLATKSGPQDPFLVALGTLSLLAAAAEERLVVALIDDAHWLDDASAHALAFAARRVQHERMALLFAVREDEAHRFHGTGLPEMTIGGVDALAAEELLRERLDVPVAAAVTERLVRETAGNPLALTEVPRMLTPEQLRGAAPLPRSLPLPGDVQGVFLERVRRLPPAAQILLLVAAADDTGRLETVVAAAGRLGLDAEALDVAEEAALVTVTDGQLRFRHPLVRSAVHQGATSRQRRAVHSALAEVLGRQADPERQVWHRAAAAWGPDEVVAGDLELAAAAAVSRGGFESACSLLQRAAELSPDAETRARRLTAAAEEAWSGGRLQLAAALLESARPLALRPEQRAAIDRLGAWIEMTVGSARTAQELLLRAITEVLAAEQPGALELVAAATETAWILQDRPAAARLSALRLPPTGTDDARDRFFRTSIGGFRSLFQGDTRTAVARLRQGIAMAESSDETQLLSWAGHAAFHVGDDVAAHRLNATVVARARTAGAVGEVLPALERLARAEFFTSRWNAATASACEARRLAGEIGQGQLSALPSAWLAVIAAHRSDDEAFEAAVADTATFATAHRLGIFEDLLRDVVAWARGLHLMAHGHGTSAMGWLSSIRHPLVVQAASLDRVEAALHTDERHSALQWLVPLETMAAATDEPWMRARVCHCQALLAEPHGAEEHFEAALNHHGHSLRTFEHGRTALAYGRFLRRNRKRVLARTHLRTAFDAFEALGARLWSEQANNELRATGETARKRTPDTVVDLTPQELQVARQVAQGQATKDVAAQLFVSPRTVEFHLRNVFTKLGITSRAELAHLPLDL